MKPNTMLWIFLAVFVVAALLYLIAILMKRRNEERLDELEKRKIDLFDLPVIEEVEEVKKMHLVGQSQNTFRDWNQKWTDISTASFAELESRIFEVENLNETFRFMKVKSAIEEAYETMDEMENQVEYIRTGLKELRESEERNSLAVQEALDKYEEISALAKQEPKQFGPAIDEIQKQVQSIENEFTQFVALNTAGDPMEARSVLEQAEGRTYALEATIVNIPPLFEELDKMFPEQMQEIISGHKKLVEQQFKFPEDEIKKDIVKVNSKIKKNLAYLEKCEVEVVQENNADISDRIDKLYDVMEIEMKAQSYVKANMKTTRDYIGHAFKNNRQLLIELDHTSQSYALNHNELGRARGFKTRLEELGKSFTTIEENLKNKVAVFSKVEEELKDTYRILDDIENQQIEINGSLKTLRKGEKVAQKKIDEFEFSLRNMKRYVDKQRLPGVPPEYLEFFFVATDRIEELSKELNKIRIDMERINKLVEYCSKDIEILEEKTNELIDSAALTEQMLQYSNRYRHSHGGVSEAIDKTLYLFTKEHRYQDALDEIGSALERTEPGAFKRIESFYFNNRDRMAEF
ncbi:MAG: septation ring formation regulator EzrA [Vagococcus salmoninarum]|uniref:septation ring formation regulator EzrA n=1 Tax=Vagococcus salmoninarum TaxID=2739 RepID=UPI003F9A1963